MGANSSSSPVCETQDVTQAGPSSASIDPLIEVRHFLVTQAVDAGRVATLSWEDFLNYIRGLNDKCKNLVDSNGKYMVFAIKKGTHQSYFWKATVRICCVKVNYLTGKVESRKILSLAQFLRLHATLQSLLVPGTPKTDLEPTRADMGISMLMADLGGVELCSGGSDLEAECVICMERKPDVLLPCAHCYCLPCIEQWNMGHQVCPICRSKMETTDDAWVISDAPREEELSQYLMALTKETDT